MTKTICVAVIIAFSLCWVSSSRNSHAATRDEVAEAKKEGEILVHSVMDVTTARKLFDIFERKYPFLKVKQYKASSNRMVNRLMTEYRAKVYQVDVLNFNDIEYFMLLDAGIGAAYESPERTQYPQIFKDKAGYWTAMHFIPVTIGYNTRLVSRSEAPKNWEDLLNTKWRKKIGMEQYHVNWYGNMLFAMGEEKGKGFMQALAGQEPTMVDGPSLLAQLMAAGEFPLGVVRAQRMEIFKESRGAPLEWVKSVHPMVSQFNVVGLAKFPPHPNAARLFIDFLLSQEAQQLVAKEFRIPARRGVKMASKAFEDLDTGKIIPPNPRVRSTINELTEEFTSLFQK